MCSLVREGSIGAILCKSRIITERDIETALEEQQRTGLRFGEALVSLGIVMQEDIDWALSNQLDIPYVRINRETVDPAASKLVPASVARRYNLFPLIRTDGELRIAMADPLNREAIAEVERISGCSASISMGLLREIREMQDFFYGTAGESSLPRFSSSCFPPSVLDAINNDGSAEILLDLLLRQMVQEGSSSISLKPLQGSVEVVSRKSGLSRIIGNILPAHYDELLSRIMVRAAIPDSAGPFSTSSLSVVMNGEAVQVQAILMQAGKWRQVTFKPGSGEPFPENLEALGIPGRTRKALMKFAAAPAGLVIFAATAPEERVQLMAALLQDCQRSKRDCQLVGKGFSLCSGRFSVVPVGRFDSDIGNWITAALCHDPSVVAVEELSDAPTVAAAIDAVLNGKLLFGGMPLSCMRAVMRQILFLQGRHPLLLDSLRGIVVSREARLLCPACKETAPPGPRLRPLLPKSSHSVFYKARGCPECRFSGYMATRRMVEALEFDGETLDLLGRSKSSGDFAQEMERRGFEGIFEEAAGLLNSGSITPEEFVSATTDGERPWLE